MTDGRDSIHNSEQGPQDGLTKRELFAAMAMQAIRSGGGSYAKWSDLSEDAVAMADALIAELNKETTT